jgi:hypothetical protein
MRRTYFMDDFTLELPEGFRDRSTHLLEWKTDDGDSVVLVAQREKLPGVDDSDESPPAVLLEQYVADQIKSYPSQFAGYRQESGEAAVSEGGSLAMRRIAFRWKKEQDVLYHHQAFVLSGKHVLVLTGAGRASHRDQVDRLLKEALDHLRVRGD